MKYSKYTWLLKGVSAALILALGVVLFSLDANKFVVTLTGAVMIIVAAVRLVPFIRTQTSDLVKTVNTIAITIEILLGIALMIISLALEANLGGFYGYIIGFYGIFRGGVHFFGINERKEQNSIITYIIHMILIVGGTYIMTITVTPDTVVQIILVISIICSSYLGVDSYITYNNYRNGQPQKEVSKEDIAHVHIEEDSDQPRPVA